ncbi:MAG: dTMP kinase [Deltaproteobacteria bacterium]|nr:dTMP kinase [Deltaproteobacteria bacterium]
MFITFEGMEGCGKSTQAKRLVDHLEQLAIPVVLTLEPGGTRVGEAIRRVLLDSRNDNLSPLAELLLYVADRAQHMEEVIKPALKQGKWVVCDRFADATTVYQGYARGQDMTLIHRLRQKTCSGFRPDITFLLDCPVDVGLKRAIRRNETLSEDGQDRFEREKRAFHEAVKQGYLTVAKEEQERFAVIDATLTEDETEVRIFRRIQPFLPNPDRPVGPQIKP